MFKAIVVSSLLDAAECFALTDADYMFFDRILLKRIRPLLKGDVTQTVEYAGCVTYDALTNTQIFRMAKILPSYIHVAVARIRLTQTWMRDPKLHAWVLTVLFSPRLPFEGNGPLGPD